MNRISRPAIFTRFLLATTALVLPMEAAAQEAGGGPQVGRGSRVRVVTRNQSASPIVGTVMSITFDSIELYLDRAEFLIIPRTEISSLQLRIGQDRKTAMGAVIGVAIGAGLGVLGREDRGGQSTDQFVATSAIGAGAWGAFFGYRSRTDRWIPATLGGADLSASAPPSGPPAPALVPMAPIPTAPLANGVAAAGLYVGSRVRVRHATGVAEGHVLGMDETRMTLTGAGGVLPIDRSSIVSVEIWTGESRRTLRGALIGAIALTAGDFIGEPECFSRNSECTRAKSVAFGAFSGAVVGAAIGALVKQSHWTPVDLGQRSRSTTGAAERGVEWGVAPTFWRKGGGLSLHMSW